MSGYQKYIRFILTEDDFDGTTAGKSQSEHFIEESDLKKMKTT